VHTVTNVVVTLLTSWLTAGRSRTQGSCSEDVSFSGVTRNEKARGKNCVMGPPTYAYFSLMANFRQLALASVSLPLKHFL
jgi:hypothetical protein